MTVKLTFEPMGKKIETSSNFILEIARDANITIRSDCGGKGLCGKCKIIIINGEVSEVNEIEREHLTLNEIRDGYRLACQVKATNGEITVFIPPESRIETRKVAESILETEAELNPSIRKVYLKLEKPTLKDTKPDFERLKSSLGEIETSLNILKRIPKFLRDANWDITAILSYNKLIGVEKGDTTDRSYGIAIDIGSSKIICQLIDLVTGKRLAEDYSENPQVAYGEDIISRINYASKSDENLKRLQKMAIDTINKILDNLCKEAGIENDEIYEAIVVGNSVMHHLFFGIYPGYVGRSPFVPAIRDMVNCQAKELGVKINPEGYINSLPLIAGFIGADALADILVTRIHEKDGINMLIDIGTNTEIFIGNKNKILACSSPSGPAFEGAHIKHGMKAVKGAIEKIWFTKGVNYETIGKEKPKGICGSALIDLVAELYRNDIINKRGKFTEKSEEDHAFIVVSADETETKKNITVNEKDIDNLLVAKGAIKSAWTILMEKLGIEPSDISKVYVAGSFGRYIDVENAKLIGLLPDIPTDQIIFAGDIAVTGAAMALKSIQKRIESREILKLIDYIELSAEKDFNKIFAKSIQL
ncbi:DUF4445 domain-containing protein [Candidatus Bipolaricaulota bacterium]|nr:DUF4445 domain-containing protein [Candidatus Bipolaricaulota bacterium]